jgi:hypothetical protein
VRELRPVPPHRGGLDDDAVHEPPHPRREVLDVRHAAELPAAERGHEHLGGHRAAHLESAPENGLIIRRNRASRARREGDGAREAVLPARREEGGGGGRRCGREHRVRPGGGVLEARDGEGTAAAWGVGAGNVVRREEEVDAKVGVRESGGHWSGGLSSAPQTFNGCLVSGFRYTYTATATQT